METDDTDEEQLSDEGFQVVVVNKGIISQPSERTGLLLRNVISGRGESSDYNTISDLERQPLSGTGAPSHVLSVAKHARRYTSFVFKRLTNPKTWDRRAFWKHGIRQPVSYIPPVILGLLLNILDALSYGKSRLESTSFFLLRNTGMILFPLGQPIFANLGPDGISMFYVSCIVSQLVYSLGGSVFKGGIGSEMVRLFFLILDSQQLLITTRSKLSLSSTRWLLPS